MKFKELVNKINCKLGFHKVSISYDTGAYIIRECLYCDKFTVNGNKWKTDEEWTALYLEYKNEEKIF
jgi:hypothetical protein